MDYINPLDSISKDAEGLKPTKLDSESAMMMDAPNICPKCKKGMAIVKLKEDEKAYWCESGCRVSSPIPEDV